MDRLAALEAEVKADADAQRARKDAALAKLRDQRVTRTADPPVNKKRVPEPRADEDDEPRRGRSRGRDDELSSLSGALELAGKANRVREDLVRKPKQGEKSWIISGIASGVLGPIGWLYAGSMREAVPAAAAWVMLATFASWLLPALLLMPALMVALPLSGIAGIIYALQYNRAGGRQRLFGDDKDDKTKPPKQLRDR